MNESSTSSILDSTPTDDTPNLSPLPTPGSLDVPLRRTAAAPDSVLSTGTVTLTAFFRRGAGDTPTLATCTHGISRLEVTEPVYNVKKREETPSHLTRLAQVLLNSVESTKPS